jgi:hypothetical protein
MIFILACGASWDHYEAMSRKSPLLGPSSPRNDSYMWRLPPFTPSAFLFTALWDLPEDPVAVNRNTDGVNGGGARSKSACGIERARLADGASNRDRFLARLWPRTVTCAP